MNNKIAKLKNRCFGPGCKARIANNRTYCHPCYKKAIQPTAGSRKSFTQLTEELEIKDALGDKYHELA